MAILSVLLWAYDLVALSAKFIPANVVLPSIRLVHTLGHASVTQAVSSVMLLLMTLYTELWSEPAYQPWRSRRVLFGSTVSGLMDLGPMAVWTQRHLGRNRCRHASRVIHQSVSHQCRQCCRSCSFKKNSEIQYAEPQLPLLPSGYWNARSAVSQLSAFHLRIRTANCSSDIGPKRDGLLVSTHLCCDPTI